MKLNRLPVRLATIATNRLPTLEAKAGTTPRIGGDRWMKIRRATLVAGNYACVDCGRVSAQNEIDHDTPLEQGGSNDSDNLRVRCKDCHKAKSATEAKVRAGR